MVFRSVWLKRIIISLITVFLCADHFDFIKQQWVETNKVVICSPQCFAKLIPPIQQPQIKCKFDVVPIVISRDFVKRNSAGYIPEISFIFLSTDLIVTPDRGPPRNIAIL